MFPLARRFARLVRLLTILLAVGRCEASQSHSQSSASSQSSANVNNSIAPYQLLRLIVQEVNSKILPLIRKLDSRLNALDLKQARLDSRLDELDSTEAKCDSRLDELVSIVDSTEARLDSRLDELDSTEARCDSRLDELVSRLDSTEAKCDSRLDELVSTDARLDSGLDELVSRVNSTEARLDSSQDELVSRVDSMEARFDSRQDSTEARCDSRLDELVSRMNSTEARLDDLVSRVNSTEDSLDDEVDLPPPRDCSELPAGAKTGVHLLQLGSQPPVSAYCDLDTDGGGWTVIQRRADVKPRQNFFLDWAAYKEGFGKLDSEFWWGLDNMHTMTAPPDRRYELRVNLGDFEGGRRHASYQQFRVASEADGYRLFVGSYTGDAGDSLRRHHGQKFSTRDRDQDGHNSHHCAQKYTGAWWYKSCYNANLNGRYMSDGRTDYRGITWQHWKYNSLKDVVMKIRPVI